MENYYYVKIGFKMKDLSLVPDAMKFNIDEEQQELYFSLKIKRKNMYSTGKQWKLTEKEQNKIVNGFFPEELKSQIESIRCVLVEYV